MAYYQKTLRYNGGIIRQVAGGWQGEINKAPHRLRATYPTLDQAKDWIEDKQTEITNEGFKALALSQSQRIETVKAIHALGNVPIMTAVEFYLRHHNPPGSAQTVAELFRAYYAAKEQANLRPRSMASIRSHCGHFIEDLGDRMVHDITANDLNAWMNDRRLKFINRRNHIVYLHGLFQFAVRQGLIEKNPAQDLERPRLDETLPDGFPVDQVECLLAAADQEKKYRRLLPWLAIGYFAGLRSAELEELKWQQVDLDRNLITVTPSTAKKRRQRYVTITENLRAWLAPYAKRKGRVTPPDITIRRLKAKLLKTTRVTWVRNGMRHSYGSYHLARWNDAQRTSMELGHTGSNATILFNHYRALVRPEAALAYWSILPSDSIQYHPPGEPRLNQDHP